MNFMIFGAILIILNVMACESALPQSSSQCGSPNCCLNGPTGDYGLKCGNGIFDLQMWEISTGIYVGIDIFFCPKLRLCM